MAIDSSSVGFFSSLPLQELKDRFGYAFVLRRYNGDWKWDMGSVSDILIHLCTCFDPQQRLDAPETILHELLSQVIVPPLGSANEK